MIHPVIDISIFLISLFTDHRPLTMEWTEEFEHRREFVHSMLDLLGDYKNMNMEEHPAIQNMINKKLNPEDFDDEAEDDDRFNFAKSDTPGPTLGEVFDQLKDKFTEHIEL